MKLVFVLGLRINGNIFLKSIVFIGFVYVCLLVDDDFDEVDGGKKKKFGWFLCYVDKYKLYKEGECVVEIGIYSWICRWLRAR